MQTLDRSRNWRALAWAMGIMLLLGAMATTRHHFKMLDGSLGGEYRTWLHAFRQEGPHWIIWALAIPVISFFVARLARRHWSWPGMLLAHVAFASLAIALALAVDALWVNQTVCGACLA